MKMPALSSLAFSDWPSWMSMITMWVFMLFLSLLFTCVTLHTCASLSCRAWRLLTLWWQTSWSGAGLLSLLSSCSISSLHWCQTPSRGRQFWTSWLILTWDSSWFCGCIWQGLWQCKSQCCYAEGYHHPEHWGRDVTQEEGEISRLHPLEMCPNGGLLWWWHHWGVWGWSQEDHLPNKGQRSKEGTHQMNGNRVHRCSSGNQTGSCPVHSSCWWCLWLCEIK